MSDVKWIKITVDMFDNRKIRYLRKLPDGNNIVLIWVMLLTMAGRCNAGGMIMLTENIPYTTKMLADELDFPENTVILAIQALENLNMVVTDESGIFTIAGWKDHQNIEGMERIREQNRLRKQRQREREKEKQALLTDGHVTSHQNHATDIDIEEDIDIDNISSSSESENEVKEEPQKQKKDLIEERFEAFWKAYPKKVGKGDARKKFHKIAPNEVLFNQMMDSLNKAKKCEQWVRDRGQYIPHPSTWLNQSRWEDEYDAPVLKTTAQELSEDEKWDNFYDRYR